MEISEQTKTQSNFHAKRAGPFAYGRLVARLVPEDQRLYLDALDPRVPHRQERDTVAHGPCIGAHGMDRYAQPRILFIAVPRVYDARELYGTLYYTERKVGLHQYGYSGIDIRVIMHQGSRAHECDARDRLAVLPSQGPHWRRVDLRDVRALRRVFQAY